MVLGEKQFYIKSSLFPRLAFLLSAFALVGCGVAAAPRVTSTHSPPTLPQPTATIQEAFPFPTLPRHTVIASPVPAPTASSVPTQGVNLALDERISLFEEVWSTVQANYLYEDFGGVNWQQMHADYLPRIKAAEDRTHFYATLAEMIDELGDQHSRFIPPSVAMTEDASVSGREVTVGIGIVARPKADGAFIQLILPNSPAERAGLYPRDRILSVDGRPYKPEDGDLSGAIGSTVRITVLRPGEKARDVVLMRQEVQMHIQPSYRRFPGDIGYVMIPTLWADDMGEQVSGALTDLVASGPMRGLILDLRANHGGWREVLSEVLSHFVQGKVGVFYSRSAVAPLLISPPTGPDLGRAHIPLIVLIDGDTASYAELMAAILKQEAGAKLVGTHTAGNTETIYAHTFSDGSRLWLAQEGFHMNNGQNLEGVGVFPDVTIDADWTRYSEDDDPQLLEALRMLGAGPK